MSGSQVQKDRQEVSEEAPMRKRGGKKKKQMRHHIALSRKVCDRMLLAVKKITSVLRRALHRRCGDISQMN